MNILFLGEIVGKGGVFCLKKKLNKLKEKYEIDFTIANGDGTTGGFGLGKNHSMYIRKLGVNAVTTGDCIYFKRDMVDHIQTTYWILRPVNYPHGNPGRGWSYFNVGNKRVAVISVMGLSGYNRTHLANPHLILPDLIERIRKETPYIIIDFHATTTAEKLTLSYRLDSHVSAVIGTGCKALTADARIMKGGTGAITDAGRTGSLFSVGGLDPEVEIQKFIDQIPERSRDCMDHLELQGVVMTLNEKGLCEAITSFREPVENNSDGNS